MFSVLLMFLGVFLGYGASQRATIHKTRITTWLQSNRVTSKIAGWIFILLAVLPITMHYGFGAGVLISCVLWMILTSALVILYPVKSVRN